MTEGYLHGRTPVLETWDAVRVSLDAVPLAALVEWTNWFTNPNYQYFVILGEEHIVYLHDIRREGVWYIALYDSMRLVYPPAGSVIYTEILQMVVHEDMQLH